MKYYYTTKCRICGVNYERHFGIEPNYLESIFILHCNQLLNKPRFYECRNCGFETVQDLVARRIEE